MNKTWMLLGGFFAAAAIVSLCLLDEAVIAQGKDDQGRNAESDEEQSVEDKLLFVGTPACSARGCHGGIEPLKKDCWQNEFTLWLRNGDPHLRAYEVLKSDQGMQIGRALKAAKIIDKEPHESPVCLVCHTTPWAATGEAERQRTERRFGVGCESCHGVARYWLNPHTRPDFKKTLSAVERRYKYGMVDVSDPIFRFQMCTRCHVGAPPSVDPRDWDGVPLLADVNHDLIAAGHPRMQFEASSFFANLPPHWNPNTPDRVKNDEGKTWALGQVVSAWAAARLLKHRADASTGSPWPEFAEYSCYACHHNLRQDSVRQAQDQKHDRVTLGSRPTKPGTLPWGEWYFSGSYALASEPATHPADAVAKCVLDCQKAMTFGARPFETQPNRNQAGEAASRLASALEALAVKLAKSPPSPAYLSAVLKVMAGPTPTSADWEVGEQTYLGLRTFLDRKQSPAEIKRLLPMRAFPSDVNGPVRYNGPEFMPQLRELLKQFP
ncbi:MAG: hypothetical protein HY040_25805 [Planctomycetes bacterium]|nr:hypothetical protein [Planctomycetota bacterium]